MGKKSYTGGSTVVGPRSGWFSHRPGRSMPQKSPYMELESQDQLKKHFSENPLERKSDSSSTKKSSRKPNKKSSRLAKLEEKRKLGLLTEKEEEIQRRLARRMDGVVVEKRQAQRKPKPPRS